MKIGDLLTSILIKEDRSAPLLLVLDIKKHPENSNKDRICLQWMPRNGGQSIKGEFSRFIVEKKYRIA